MNFNNMASRALLKNFQDHVMNTNEMTEVLVSVPLFSNKFDSYPLNYESVNHVSDHCFNCFPAFSMPSSHP